MGRNEDVMGPDGEVGHFCTGQLISSQGGGMGGAGGVEGRRGKSSSLSQCSGRLASPRLALPCLVSCSLPLPCLISSRFPSLAWTRLALSNPSHGEVLM